MLVLRSIVLAVAGASLLLGSGCKGSKQATAPLPQEPPATRAASSFVHCVEAGTSGCIESEDTSGGWDALYLLTWLGSGSPVAILETLPAQLDSHRSRRDVQGRFVAEVERYAAAMRGAECDPVRTEPIDPIVDASAQAAEQRLRSLGLWRGSMQDVVAGLAEEAHGDLGGGHLVHMHCGYDPYRLYLVVRQGDRGEQSVVGMTTLWPEYLGGELPAREVVDERLESRWLGLSSASAPIEEGTIHPWLPFSVEEL